MCIYFLEKLIAFIQTFPYDIKGGSILIIIDHISKDSIIKLIDLASITKYSDVT